MVRGALEIVKGGAESFSRLTGLEAKMLTMRCPNLFRMATRPWHVEANAERGLVYCI